MLLLLFIVNDFNHFNTSLAADLAHKALKKTTNPTLWTAVGTLWMRIFLGPKTLYKTSPHIGICSFLGLGGLNELLLLCLREAHELLIVLMPQGV